VPEGPFRVGAWLPSDQRVLDAWLSRLAAAVEQEYDDAGTLGTDRPGTLAGPERRPGRELLPVVEEFQRTVDEDPELYMLFRFMLQQVPYDRTPTDQPQVKNTKQMFRMFDRVLRHAPEYDDTGLVGFPINAILDWAMGTQAGFAAFLNDKANACFKKMLDQWAVFLASPDSCHVLHQDDNGWLGPKAMAKMPRFAQEYVCRPQDPHYGFTSWDDFFARRFRPGARPVAFPDDPRVVVNACESAPYCLRRDVRWRDEFWMKGQPYSISHMLAGDPLAEVFVGGTVYQAFLSALSYHRWHCPVDGRIVRAYVQDGSYYSQTPVEGFDPEGPNRSQAYLTEVATRAIILIEADDPAIGLMGVLFVGMAEASTCEITVYEGQRVCKGQEMGAFHFGGSTHCLLFRPGVDLDFDLRGQSPGLDTVNVPVNSRIATVR
jgi:phosphatidylserine decarboxylase